MSESTCFGGNIWDFHLSREVSRMFNYLQDKISRWKRRDLFWEEHNNLPLHSPISEKDSLKIPQEFSLSICLLLSIMSILLDTVGDNFGERSAIGRVPLHKAATGGGAGDGRWNECVQKLQNSLFLAAVLFAASGVPRTEWTWGPNCHSLLSRQFLPGQDWKHPVVKARCWGQFALLLFWLDSLVAGEKPSSGQWFPAHPFNNFSQKYISFSWKKILNDLTAYHQEEITMYILHRQDRALEKLPWFILCKCLLCAKNYLSWIPGSSFSFFLPPRVSTSESSKMQVHHSTNVQSPENVSSPNY